MFRKTKNYNHDSDSVYMAALSAINMLGYSIEHTDKDSGVLTFSTGGSLFSWYGQSMTALASDSGNGSRLAISGTRKTGEQVQIFDWGEKGRIAKKIFREIDESLGVSIDALKEGLKGDIDKHHSGPGTPKRKRRTPQVELPEDDNDGSEYTFLDDDGTEEQLDAGGSAGTGTTAQSAAELYIRRGSDIRGPFDRGAIRKLITSKKVKKSDEISSTDDGPWELLGGIYKSFL